MATPSSSVVGFGKDTPRTFALRSRNPPAPKNPGRCYKSRQPSLSSGTRCSHLYLHLHQRRNDLYEPHQRGNPLLRQQSSKFGNDQSCYEHGEKYGRAYSLRGTWSHKHPPKFHGGAFQVPLKYLAYLSYPNTMVLPLAKSSSDHLPCVVTFVTSIPKSRIFRFENFWVNQAGF